MSCTKIGDHRALPHLIRLADDPEWSIRCSVAWSLGKIGNPAAYETLVTLSNVAEELVRRQAQESLRALKGYRIYIQSVTIVNDYGVGAMLNNR